MHEPFKVAFLLLAAFVLLFPSQVQCSFRISALTPDAKADELRPVSVHQIGAFRAFLTLYSTKPASDLGLHPDVVLYRNGMPLASRTRSSSTSSTSTVIVLAMNPLSGYVSSGVVFSHFRGLPHTTYDPNTQMMYVAGRAVWSGRVRYGVASLQITVPMVSGFGLVPYGSSGLGVKSVVSVAAAWRGVLLAVGEDWGGIWKVAVLNGQSMQVSKTVRLLANNVTAGSPGAVVVRAVDASWPAVCALVTVSRPHVDLFVNCRDYRDAIAASSNSRSSTPVSRLANDLPGPQPIAPMRIALQQSQPSGAVYAAYIRFGGRIDSPRRHLVLRRMDKRSLENLSWGSSPTWGRLAFRLPTSPDLNEHTADILATAHVRASDSVVVAFRVRRALTGVVTKYKPGVFALGQKTLADGNTDNSIVEQYWIVQVDRTKVPKMTQIIAPGRSSNAKYPGFHFRGLEIVKGGQYASVLLDRKPSSNFKIDKKWGMSRAFVQQVVLPIAP